ncbi:Ferric/cupric reductase transmembrane component B [Fulvia fulva]|uniref:Ferric/cupric reductase transmembrane component B n=1 Tax=Passalora fulva TaxID=5499 RepID=A0A9Q8PKH1_PASFU|nr:Ferric/cupric reductase transmembrane component B [Fulvia fulva]UJO24165.1 Ferric/cupric reductase transmembrane component B [Fulvia fulva]WPV22013.1 Ferric/cupric reductase transmembrane component B [Fulvia fulva]WPV36871.1 Ferric/cupric reductase transmembrane component B [Fulvia fulva]
MAVHSICKAHWLLLTLFITSVLCSKGTRGSGFVGYGITMYKPACATACRDVLSAYSLECEGDNQDHSHMRRMAGMGAEKVPPSPSCYAVNDPYLQSLAYCISQHCEDIPIYTIEQWWNRRVTGRVPGQPKPKETYQQSLAKIVVNPPTNVTESEEMLMEPSLVEDETWLANFHGDSVFEKNERMHVTLGLILLLTGAGIPIATSLLRFVPFPRTFVTRFNAIFIDPPAWGIKHRVPVANTLLVPTRGQALFIAYIWIINILACSLGYEVKTPDAWWATVPIEVATLVSYRTGVLSFVNLALLILYAGRNNILLYVTNWSHSTYLLLHRWIAVIATLQACLHSAILLKLYLDTHEHATESKLPYWIWGIVATLGLVVMLPLSALKIRQKAYEFFLVWHQVLAFFVLIGGLYHVVLRFNFQWGYETWLYIAFGFWGSDRLMRFLRIARNGVRYGRVTIIDEDYVRLDIPGVSTSGQAYLYFPTLTWRVWENHPFSIAGGLEAHQTSQPPRSALVSDEKMPAHEIKAIESDSASGSPARSRSLSTQNQQSCKGGLTFFIRTHPGLTSKLRDRKTLSLLVESSYGQSLVGAHDLSSYPNLICIAGGVGITAVLPFLSSQVGRNKLFWGVRTPSLANALRDTLGEPAFAGTEVSITHGERMNLKAILEREIREEGRDGDGTAVVVSGPPSMADDVRVIVSRLARENKKAVVAFVEESYSW